MTESRTEPATDTAAVSGTVTSAGEQTPAELLQMRHSIDNIDASIIYMLAERFKCTQRVGVLKATTGLPASDPAREARQVERMRRLCDESGLDPVFAEKFLAFVVKEVIRHHEEIAEELG